MPTVLDPLSILVVDDNRDAANSLACLLRLHGYEVSVAFDGDGALRAAQASRPDAVTLDLALPDIDGLDVAARLRALLTPPPLLVAISGFCRPADKERSRRAGFAAHLGKPFDVTELLRLFETHAGKALAAEEGSAELRPAMLL